MKTMKTLQDEIQSYWAGTGKYQDAYSKLHALIPSNGKCPKERPALEALRVAANCYYDLFNNGLCNRADQFNRVFGFLPKGFDPDDMGWEMDADALHVRLNPLMDHIIGLAAAEHLGQPDAP